MHFKFLLLLLSLALGLSVNAQKLESKQLLNGKITMMVPREFTLMADSLMKIKYPHERRPKVVFTDKRSAVNVTLTHSEDKLSQPQIEDMLRVTRQTFKNIQPSAEWLNYGVTTVNGRVVGYMELITPALDTRIYNLMFFTDVDGRAVLF